MKSSKRGKPVPLAETTHHAPSADPARGPRPWSFRIRVAQDISGLSRSEIYRRAKRGEVVLLKCGRTTLVDAESLRACVAGFSRDYGPMNAVPRRCAG